MGTVITFDGDGTAGDLKIVTQPQGSRKVVRKTRRIKKRGRRGGGGGTGNRGSLFVTEPKIQLYKISKRNLEIVIKILYILNGKSIL